jgi:hypothetical protein
MLRMLGLYLDLGLEVHIQVRWTVRMAWRVHSCRSTQFTQQQRAAAGPSAYADRGGCGNSCSVQACSCLQQWVHLP